MYFIYVLKAKLNMIDTMECMSPLRKHTSTNKNINSSRSPRLDFFFALPRAWHDMCHIYVGVRPKFNGNSFKNKMYTELYSELMDYSNVLRVLL